MINFERHFEGRDVLQKLLEQSGTLADVEDVANALTQAIAQKAPPQAVIEALWDDEPRFQSPKDAARLFSNLLGLYDLLESGVSVDLSVKQKAPKRPKVERPESLGESPLSPDFIESAWKYFDDFPNEKKKLCHRFDNVFHELVTWLDSQSFSDAEFSCARNLVEDVFCILELSGKSPKAPTVKMLDEPKECSVDLANYIEASLLEIEADETLELSETSREKLFRSVCQCVAALG
jgi:hypothetical protein